MFKQVLSFNGARRVRAILALNMMSGPRVRLASKASSTAAGSKDDFAGEKCEKKAEDATWSDGGERTYSKQSDVTKKLRVMLKAELRDGTEYAKQLQMPTRTFENVNTLTYVEYKPQRRSECVRSQPNQSWTNVEVGRRLSRNSRSRLDNADSFKLTTKTVNGAEQAPKDAKSFDKALAKQAK